MKKVILKLIWAMLISNYSQTFGQSLSDFGLFASMPYDIELELQRWGNEWKIDSYVKGSVVINDWQPANFKQSSSWNQLGLNKITGLSTEDKLNHGAFANGIFYVSRFGSKLKTNFNAYAYYSEGKKIIRICYKDNVEQRCND